MHALLRDRDWSRTPLGPLDRWPQSLKTATDIVLNSPVAMVMMWGVEGVLIYNDAYAAFAGDKHPQAFGMGAREAWPEIADHNDGLIHRVLGGEKVSLRDQELMLDRRGVLEPAWMDLDYSPVHDETGRPAGVLVVVVETTDRILAGRQSRTADERLELALSASSGVGTWDWDIEADRVVADARFARLYGVDPEKAKAGAPLVEFFGGIHPEDAPRIQAEIERALETGEMFREEYRLIQADGAVRWVTAEGRALPARDGQPRRFPGVTYDITERVRDLKRQAALITLDDAFAEIEDPEEVASVSARILGEVLGVARVGYGLIDADARSIDVTRDWTAPGMPSVVGHHDFEAYGSYVSSLLQGEAVRIREVANDPRVADPGPLLAYGIEALMDVPLTEGGRTVAQILVHSDRPRDWTDADVAYVRAFAERTRAAVERRRAEHAAHVSEERYRSLFETIDEGFCVVEMKFDAAMRPVDYRIVEGNAAFETLTGLKDANGKWVSEIAPGLEQHWFDLYGQVALTGEAVRFENPADIFGRWYDVHAMRIGAPEQHRVAILFNNITARKLSEQRQGALLAFNERLANAADAGEAGLIAAETLAERLGGARAGYGWVDMDAETVSYEREWTREGAIAPARTAHLRQFGSFIDDLKLGQTVIAPDIRTHPATQGDAGAYAERGVAAFAVVPILDRGRLTAIITVASPEQQDWSEADVGLMEEVASRAAITIERLSTEEALRESEERYRTLFETMDEGFCVIEFIDGPDGKPLDDYVHVQANPAYAENAGIPDIVGKRLREIVGDEGDEWVRLYRDVLETGRSIRFEKELEATGRWLELAAFRVEPRARNQVAVLFKDLTSRKQAEADLRESEERYRTLFSSIDEGFCLIEVLRDGEGKPVDYRFLEVNPAFLRHTGLVNAVGRTMRDFAPEHEQHWFDIYGRVADSGEPMRFEDNAEALGRYYDVYAFRVGEPGQDRVAVLFNDVSVRRKAELALRELNQTLEDRITEAVAERNVLADVVESVDAFVQVVDPDLRWLAVNRAASDEYERVFGLRPRSGDTLPQTLAHLPEEVERFERIWRQALAGESVHEIMAVGDPAIQRNPHEIRLYPLRDAEGEVIGAFKFGYDISDRLAEQQRLREAEEALRQSQKMEAVGQLTGGIAHDFNNLLAGISGSLELLNKRLAEGRTTGLDRYITAAQGASQRAASLTQRLLAFSRRQTLDPRPTDVNRLIHGMEELIRRSVGPDVEVEVVGAAGLWPTRIDQPQLENALLNLCINARDAMAPDGGRLTIETANKWLDDRASRERELPPGQYVSLCVTDTGTGMTPEVLEKIFEPFFTTKPLGQGTGLGLSMIHGFVRQSGGQVRVYSEPGDGTTMCLYLPRYVGPMETQDARSTGYEPVHGHGETILVIDDEPTVRMLVAEVLNEAGYIVLEAEDGPSGLRILESGARIDLLVTDVGLPGGMNGRQVADAARVRRPELKVLFITGYAENAAVGNGLLEPGMEVITKPFVMTELSAKVVEMVEGPPGIA